MLNVLVVDDDRFVAESLEQKIDWTALDVNRVYVAYNIHQAKNILTECPIQILISDIDMPQGNGLELLAWIREMNYEIQTIFLTNYADFNYAQKAIELKSFEYYLKPIEFDKLTLIISKAIQQVRLVETAKRKESLGLLWEQNKSRLYEHFWFQMIETRNAASDGIKKTDDDLNQLSYLPSDLFLTLLFTLYPYQLSSDGTKYSCIDRTADFINLFSDIIINTLATEHITPEVILKLNDNEEQFICIIKLSASTEHISSSVFHASENIISKINEKLHSDIQICIGTPCDFSSFHSVLNNVLDMSENILTGRNSCYELRNYKPIYAEYTEPNLELLEQLLYTGNQASFMKKCEQYLYGLTNRNGLNKSVICSFRVDITQLIYSFLKKHEVLAHKVLPDNNERLLEESSKSIDDMLMYVSFLVKTALNYVQFSASQKSVSNIIREYIDINYSQNITRSNLAEIVYLNPDHTARLFKREFNISLGNYIIQKRISAAKSLLAETDLPVNIISDKVGYANYSYFTKLFKKETDYTPLEYRKCFSKI